MELDFEQCYRAVDSRDRRFDGRFYTGVTSTGIYCRPSCPAITPKRRNVQFYRSAAAAQAKGFRACMRCRPDAAPGSPEWDHRADAVGRAMRLIADGVVDRDGVGGLARRLGYTERHLNRMLITEMGAGPLALARAQRAQTARILVETTDLGLAEVAFAAGFGSVRQFNDTMREVYAAAPSALRTSARKRGLKAAAGGTALTVRLTYRSPLHLDALFDFLRFRAIPGVEVVEGTSYHRTLRLPHGAGTATLTPADGYVRCALNLADLRDLAPAVARCRRLFDLDADPEAVDDALAADPAFAAVVKTEPGVRVPRAADGFELAVRAIVGQQVSVASARAVLTRMTRDLGKTLGSAHDQREERAHWLFPTAEAVAEAPDEALPMPAARQRTIRALAAAVADGKITLDGDDAIGGDRSEVVESLLNIPGIGPWTTSYIALRALGDPDAFLATDLGVRRGAAALGLPDDPKALEAHAERWRPWRSYACIRLWRNA